MIVDLHFRFMAFYSSGIRFNLEFVIFLQGIGRYLVWKAVKINLATFQSRKLATGSTSIERLSVGVFCIMDLRRTIDNLLFGIENHKIIFDYLSVN